MTGQQRVFVSSFGAVAAGKRDGATPGTLASDAVDLMLGGCPVDPADIDFVAFANSTAGVIQRQSMIRGQAFLKGSPLAGRPCLNVDNACASGSSAFHTAYVHVAGGAADIAVAVGVEKMHDPSRLARTAITQGVDGDWIREKYGLEVQSSEAGPVMMDVYAEMANAYMARSGATKDVFATIAAKSHTNGAKNPIAGSNKARTAEEVLASRHISGPLHLLMCSPISDGAAACLLMSQRAARSLRCDGPRVLASVLASGNASGGNGLVASTAARAFQKAHIEVGAVDVIELHDAAASAEPQILEELGFFPENSGWKACAEGATEITGLFPVNPSGGLVSRGHPIGATGLYQISELVAQLGGAAGVRQVKGAKVGLAENAGGWLGNGPAACGITILGT